MGIGEPSVVASPVGAGVEVAEASDMIEVAVDGGVACEGNECESDPRLSDAVRLREKR